MINIPTKAVVPSAVCELFDAHYSKNRVLYFYPHCGMEKRRLLARCDVRSYSAQDTEYLFAPLDEKHDVVQIDDFQNPKKPEEQHILCS